jgi:hypothetical protein
LIRSRFESRRDGAVSELLERGLTRELNPYGAARELLAALKEEGTHEAA